MRFLENIGDEFLAIRRGEDVYVLSRVLNRLEQVVDAGDVGFDEEGPHLRDLGYLLELGLARMEQSVLEDRLSTKYYPTLKGIQVNAYVKNIGKKGE